MLLKLEHDSLLAIEWYESKMSSYSVWKKYEHIFAKVGKELIWESSSEKLLGVIINNGLNFRQHIENICKKANRKLTALIRLSR